METNQIKEYLEKLKEFENHLSSENEFDAGFINEINHVLTTLGNDLSTPQFNTNYQNGGVMVKVKKLTENAVIPRYSQVGDAGMDLTITSIINETPKSITYGFGIAMEIPKGYVGLLFPRSSVRKHDLILSNCVGVIDSGYRGEIQATYKKINHSQIRVDDYQVGDRGAQIIILPYPQVYMTEVLELSDTERGEGGFGSTGK